MNIVTWKDLNHSYTTSKRKQVFLEQPIYSDDVAKHELSFQLEASMLRLDYHVGPLTVKMINKTLFEEIKHLSDTINGSNWNHWFFTMSDIEVFSSPTPIHISGIILAQEVKNQNTHTQKSA